MCITGLKHSTVPAAVKEAIMKASIIAVGTELLFGQTINTNAAYLSEQLNLMGFDVMYHFVVGDNQSRLRQKLEEAFASTDIVIMTGGLGPTQDDLTKETVAEFMGVGMYRDAKVEEDIREFFHSRGTLMPSNNLKQADLPLGCTPLYNPTGTAPGFALEACGKTAVCLPGPPREMKWLFENGGRQYLENFTDKKLFYRIIRTIGIGESDIETVLLPLIDGQTDPTIATYAKEGECTLRIASQRSTLQEAEAAVDEMTEAVSRKIGDYIYSFDNEELNQVVVKLLKTAGLTVSSAESCTGGLFAASITSVPGSSQVLSSSFVTYSSDAKSDILFVPSELIDEYGVVSSEVAEAMATGARLVSGSDIGISVTGFAGPDADEGHAPGEAYIGYSFGDITGCDRILTSRDLRNWNRNYFTLRMLRRVYLLLRNRADESNE